MTALSPTLLTVAALVVLLWGEAREHDGTRRVAKPLASAGFVAVALAAGARLAGSLTVTVIVTGDEEIVPPDADMDIVQGRIASAGGGLGAFAITVDGFAEIGPAGRGARAFGAKRDGAKSECDLIVDLYGVELGHHARTAFGVAELPFGLAVEIDCEVAIPR